MAPLKKPSQTGSMILLLFVCVALFGALAYAVTQGSRSSVEWLKTEEIKSAATGTADCSNTVNLAFKRLELRGCGSLISALPDGSNTIPGAPTDGSCSIYHPNGGGARNCSNLAMPVTDLCVGSPARGTQCADGSWFIGTGAPLGNAGTNYYAAPTDEPGTYMLKTTSTYTAGADDYSDGVVSTNAMIAGGPALHPAAQACRARGPQWFLLSVNELNNIMGALPSIAATIGMQNGSYWAGLIINNPSFQRGRGSARNFIGGGGSVSPAATAFRVRCFRKV